MSEQEIQQQVVELRRKVTMLTAQVVEFRKKVAILTRLAGISASLNSSVDLDALLKRIMNSAVAIVGCEAASVLLWNKARQQLVFQASTTIGYADEDLIGTVVPMDSIAGEIFRKNQAIEVNNVKTDPRHYTKVGKDIQFEIRTLLGVPLTYKDNVIGVLEAINKHEMPWTADDRNYLSIIASQAAVAIEGAQLVADLRTAYEELNELDQLKNDFIAIASHELRTPLGVIMGYASFLQEEESPSAQEHASKVLESALRLRKIIEDMVNLRYLKQSKGDLVFEDVTIESMFKILRQEVDTVMDLSQYDFVVEQPDEPCSVHIDHTRLTMALINLLHNAISFSNAGDRITLSARVMNDGREVYLAVQDTGLGIEAAELERIFEEFYQVEDHMTRKHGGLGIGLSIARAIVEAHDGRIWAESAGKGRGSTFTIALPLRKRM